MATSLPVYQLKSHHIISYALCTAVYYM